MQTRYFSFLCYLVTRRGARYDPSVRSRQRVLDWSARRIATQIEGLYNDEVASSFGANRRAHSANSFRDAAGAGAKITVQIRALEKDQLGRNKTIAAEDADKEQNQKSVIQVIVTVVTKTGKGQTVFASPVIITNGDSVPLLIPAEFTALRLDISDKKGLKIPAVLDAVLNVEQTITVVLPEKQPEAVVCNPQMYWVCPPTYVQCQPRTCGCRLFGFLHR